MKIPKILLAFACLASAGLSAADQAAAGPRGGRLLEATPLRAEFFVTKERRIEIVFLDASRRPVAPGEREVAVTAELPAGRTPIALEKTATGFASPAPFPAAAESARVVVQIREKPGARPQNFRLDLKLEPCGECKLAEYACTCSH
ncbi:MAG: hypothetical protein FJ399_03540 [Verrucomicrobia bacterium]|nr:hypothetical protein [Verrucomicrobiota bacterium]